MEKRRRARINQSLAILKSLIVDNQRVEVRKWIDFIYSFAHNRTTHPIIATLIKKNNTPPDSISLNWLSATVSLCSFPGARSFCIVV